MQRFCNLGVVINKSPVKIIEAEKDLNIVVRLQFFPVADRVYSL